jgi:hypothetical protein
MEEERLTSTKLVCDCGRFSRENKKKAYGESAGRRATSGTLVMQRKDYGKIKGKDEKKGEGGMSEVGRLKEGKAKGRRKEKEVKKG